MTTSGEHEREPEGDDIVAAEYVLGVLAEDERRAAARRIDAEPEFARLVDAWEVRLAPVGEAYQPVAAPPALKEAIDGRLFAGAALAPVRTEPARTPFLQRLAFWRLMTAAAVAALAIAIALPAMRSPAEAPTDRLVASLTAADSDVRYVAIFDRAGDRVGLSHLAGDRTADQDFELWMIEGDNAPVSLGVIPSGAKTEIPLTAEERQKIARGAVLAISLEPRGGSPTGAPTGPVVAAGDLHEI